MTSSTFKVLIIGGGSCGLALAQGLRKANIPYTLYERDSAEEYHKRPRDWGALLHWAQGYMQKCLPEEIWQRRAEMYVDPWFDYTSCGASVIWDSVTGETIKEVDAVPGTVRVSRRKVRLLLSQGLEIEYGKRLSSVSSSGETVTAHFDDGTSATGSLLIGCDGGRSKVREYIVGAEAARGFDSDYTMINTWLTCPAETALALRRKHPIVSFTTGAGVGVKLVALLDVPYKGAPPETWKFQVHTGWKGFPRKADLDSQEKRMRVFKESCKATAEPFLSVGEAMPETDVLPVDDGWNFKPTGDFEWDNHGGKVTLAGDAAHSMLPHRGQGLNNAIMDAAGLVDVVERVFSGKKELQTTVTRYEDEMRPRGSQEVDLTLHVMATTARKDIEKSPIYTLGLQKPKT